MKLDKFHPYTFIFALLCISVVITALMTSLGGEEARRFVAAYESYYFNDLLSPTLFGQAYYNKPPLYTSTIALLFKSVGPSLFVLRLFSVACIVSIGILLYKLSVRYFPSLNPWLSPMIFMGFADFYLYQINHLAEMDFFFTLLIFLGLFYILKTVRNQTLQNAVLCGIVFALAFMVKGIPALIFCATALIIAFFVFSIKWRVFLLGSTIVAAMISLTIVTYFYFYDQLAGNALAYISNLFLEVGDKSTKLFDWSRFVGHFLSFPFRLLIYLLPWCLLLVMKLPNRESLANIRRHPVMWFFALYIFFNLLPYWISVGSKGRYILPLLPVFAMIFGVLFHRKFRLTVSSLNAKIILFVVCLATSVLQLLGNNAIEWFHIVFILIIWLGFAFFLFIQTLKRKSIDLFILIPILLIIMRLGLNLQSSASNVHRMQRMNQMIELAGDEAIYYHARKQVKSLCVLNQSITIEHPSYIAFEYPYYYILRKNQPLRFTTFESNHSFVLSLFHDYWNSKSRDFYDIDYMFYEEWSHNSWVLLKRKN